MSTKSGSRKQFLKYGVFGAIGALGILAIFGFQFLGAGINSAHSDARELEGAQPLPKYLASEAKTDDGITDGVFLGSYQGNEYWEAIDKAGNQCLLVVDPDSGGGATSCTPSEFYETMGSGSLFLIPESENPTLTEAALPPTDVDAQLLAQNGYYLLEGRVAIAVPGSVNHDKKFPLPRTDESKPAFVYLGAPVVDEPDFIPQK